MSTIATVPMVDAKSRATTSVDGRTLTRVRARYPVRASVDTLSPKAMAPMRGARTPTGLTACASASQPAPPPIAAKFKLTYWWNPRKLRPTVTTSATRVFGDRTLRSKSIRIIDPTGASPHVYLCHEWARRIHRAGARFPEHPRDLALCCHSVFGLQYPDTFTVTVASHLLPNATRPYYWPAMLHLVT